MNYQYPDQDGPYAMPNYQAGPPRHRPIQTGYNQQSGHSAPDRNRAPPALRQQDPGPPPRGRPPIPSQPRPQYQPQSPTQYVADSYYNEGFDDNYQQYDSNYMSGQHWPLPPRQRGQQQTLNNQSRNSPRTPQNHQDWNYAQPHPAVRVPPSSRQRANPQDSHHVASQWSGEGYGSPSDHTQYTTQRMVQQSPPSASSPYDDASGTQTTFPNPQTEQSPLQEQHAFANKRTLAPLGPPPSARRGPQSYYPEVGPVQPITEETDSQRASSRYTASMRGAHDSVRSYASSNAIPIGLADQFMHDEELPTMPGRFMSQEFAHPHSLSAQGATEEAHDPHAPSPEPPVLLRQASWGRKSKPTLTTVKPGDKNRKSSGSGSVSSGVLPSQSRDEDNAQHPPMPTESQEVPALGGNTDAVVETEKSASSLRPGPTPINSDFANKSQDNLTTHTSSSEILAPSATQNDRPESESDQSVKRKVSRELLAASALKGTEHRPKAASPLSASDPFDKEIEIETGKSTMSSPTMSEQLKSPKPGFSERGRRRPPRLDVDAVKKAEARGSLTSLSDLILRATRLASNLDRGKTASRLGTDWFTSDGTESEKRWANSQRNSRASQDILGTTAAPNPHRGSRGAFSSHLQHRTLPSDSDVGELKGKKKRRCCGMPLWAFLLVLALLICCVAAAVLVPIFLIVVPRQNHSGNGSSAASEALAKCQKATTCQNGGVNVVGRDGSCGCVCVNGFTGSTCSTHSEGSCAMMTVGSTTDATVGDAIPRLITSGKNNFSIPLDEQTLLGLFSRADLSCASENALVSFSNINRRDATSTSNDNAASTNGIVYETGSPYSKSASPTSTSSSPPTTSSASPKTSSNPKSPASIDFARVAVLFVLQVSGELNSAVMAQESLQSYFTNNQTSTGQAVDPSKVSLGNGYFCNLSGHTVTLRNSTTVGY